jgi:hypothetical protein
MTTTSELTIEQELCDRPGADGASCTHPATQAYAWDWGESGVCCDMHATLLQQIAAQVQRTLVLSPLRKQRQPLGRDERCGLQARVLVLQEEVEEGKIRGLELYRVNQSIYGEMRLAKVRSEEAHVQLTGALEEIERLHHELAKRDTENATLLQELERLRLFESLQPALPPPAPPVPHD